MHPLPPHDQIGEGQAFVHRPDAEDRAQLRSFHSAMLTAAARHMTHAENMLRKTTKGVDGLALVDVPAPDVASARLHLDFAARYAAIAAASQRMP